MAVTKKDLEETIKEKVVPLLEETMERQWGITIPKIEADITDTLLKPQIQFYLPANTSFKRAKRLFKAAFIKNELKVHQGNISHLARTLGLDRRSIHRAIKELEIDVTDVRGQLVFPEEQQREFVDQAIRSTLDKYKEIIQAPKIEQMYSELSKKSKEIAQLLPRPELTFKEAEREFERQFLEQALRENKGNIPGTAKMIEVRTETLYRKVKRLGVGV